jgi:hypothetical protein
MDQAAAMLGDIRSERSQEAMSMAELAGAPVDVGEFTQGIDLEQQLFTHTAANEMLSSIADAQAGSQEAMAFATNVLPLVQKEEESTIRQLYDKEINGINQEIARIKSTKGDRVNARFNELLVQEREWLLAKTQAERDWKVAQQSLKNELERLELERASLFGVDKNGNLTLDATLGLQAQDMDAKINTQKEKVRAGELIQQVVSGSTQKVPQWIPVGPGSSGAVQMQAGNPYGLAPGWYLYKEIEQTTPGLSKPNDIYDYLIMNGISNKVARGAVRTYIGNPKWKPHVKVPSMPGFVGGPTGAAGSAPNNDPNFLGFGLF